jgi:hypothetical protein
MLDLSESQGALVAGGGIAVFLLSRIVGSSFVRAIGFLAAIAGAGLYARARFVMRNKRIEEAASHIRSELDDLDPIAKAQVIADLAQEQL